MYKVQVNLNSFLFRSLINTSVTTRNIIFTDMQNNSLPNDIFIYLIVIREYKWKGMNEFRHWKQNKYTGDRKWKYKSWDDAVNFKEG